MEPEQPVEEPVVTPPSSGDVGQHVDFKQRPKKSIWRWLTPVIVVVIVAGLAVVALKPGHKAKSTTTAAADKSTTAQTADTSVPTKSYTSTTFNLSFDYPEAWTVNDSGTPPLTVTSPVTTLTDASGKQVSAEIIMTILPTGQPPKDFDAGNAVAVRDSEKVSYSKPTSSQRAQTYLSFVQYAATTAHGALDGIYITGNLGYKKTQPIPKTDIAPRDPIVGITFVKCANATCSGSVAAPLSIKATEWDSSTFKAPIKTMLTSLAFD